MSPEAPGSLVVLDLAVDEAGTWTADVDRWDPVGEPNAWLRVSWSAESCTGEWQPAGGGAVCVIVPPGVPALFQRHTYAAANLEADNRRLLWRDAPTGEGLMLVVILPPAWVMLEPGQASRPPVDAKVFGDRFTAYWLLHEHADVQVWWRVSPLTDGLQSVDPAVQSFRSAILDAPTVPGGLPVLVEP